MEGSLEMLILEYGVSTEVEKAESGDLRDTENVISSFLNIAFDVGKR